MWKLICSLLLLASSCFAQQPGGSPGIIAVNSQPAVSTKASATVAARDGYRHVINKVCFSAGSTTAPVLTQLSVDIKDGSTVVQNFVVIIPAATGQNVLPFCSAELNIKGSLNAAATAEFSLLLTNLFEQVTLFYYDLSN